MTEHQPCHWFLHTFLSIEEVLKEKGPVSHTGHREEICPFIQGAALAKVRRQRRRTLELWNAEQ